MKREPTITTLDTAGAPRAHGVEAETKEQVPDDAIELSRERLREGVSTTTAVLSEILHRQTGAELVRHWGINE